LAEQGNGLSGKQDESHWAIQQGDSTGAIQLGQLELSLKAMTDNRLSSATRCWFQALLWVAAGCLAIALPQLPAVLAEDELAASTAKPVTAAALQAESITSYQQTIRPLLAEFCFDCHGNDSPEGDLALSELDPAMAVGSDAERWHEALNRINLGEMPPEDGAQPSDEQRRQIVQWLTDSLELARQSSKNRPKNVIRRLTKQQYSHTLADLLDLPIDFGRNLPADPLSEMGFTNGSETLSMTSLQAEYYQSIARKALDKAIVTGDRPASKRFRATLGHNVGKQGQAAVIGGYQSGPIPRAHVRVEILDGKGAPRSGATEEEKAELRQIERNIGIGMRGSTSDRYRIIDKGLVLYSALPHQEKVPKSWQGPSPNMKMLIRRCYPREGPFVTRVVATQASVEDYNSFEGLTTLRTSAPLIQLPAEANAEPNAEEGAEEDSKKGATQQAAEPIVKPGAIVLPCDKCLRNSGLVARGNALVPRDITKNSNAVFKFQLEKEGYYQVDMVHPAASDDAMPSVSLKIDKSDQHLRLELEEEQRSTIATPLAHAFLRKGKHTLEIGGKFFVGFSHVVLTPLADDHPAVIELRNELSSDQEKRVGSRTASLRAFIGTRTDDGMEYGEYDGPQAVDAKPGEWQTFEFHGQLENLPVPIYDEIEKSSLSNIMLVGVWNDHLVKHHSDSGVPIVVRSIELEAPYYPVWPPKSHTQIFFDSPERETNNDAYTRQLIARFMKRAFRRETAPEEVDRYYEFWRSIRSEHADYQEGVKETLVAILCSPRFLYLANPTSSPLADAQGGAPAVGATAPNGGTLGESALAERLAYFLWNSPPDEQLLELASQNKLRGELPTQVDRMLSDSRVDRFIRSFCSQWLRLDRQQAMSVNIKTYPDYTRFVKRDMQLETFEFFHHVLSENLSLFTLIDSDFAMLNQNLAEFYGIAGVQGNHFRPVPLSPDAHRGGLLSQGAFLTGHSDGTQSHPIKRAVWLKEKILGSPPPPPPPNVPELDPDTPGFEKLTLKEQLELHRDKASCVDCHRNIDPYGVVFENYDAVGRYRDKAKGRPVDARTKLPDGAEIEGVAALKSHILEHQRDDFTRSVVRHLLAYALGRDLTFADDPDIDQIVRRVSEGNDSLRSVIVEITKSPLFTGSERIGSERIGSEETAPEETAPEGTAPEGTAPEGTSSEGTSSEGT